MEQGRVSAAAAGVLGYRGDYGDWQRQQVVDTLLAARQLTDLTLSAAVWGIYENSWGWSSVSEGNIAYYQDSRAFLSEGALDANLPMVYWPVTATPGERLDFRTLVQDHVDHASGRHVYAGVSATNLSWSQVAECIAVSKEVGAQGAVLFDYKAVRDNGWLDDLAAGPWAAPSVVPERTWR